jgi:hypothetical protein
VALGNAPASADIHTALARRADHPSALVREHVAWALRRHPETRSPADARLDDAPQPATIGPPSLARDPRT